MKAARARARRRGRRGGRLARWSSLWVELSNFFKMMDKKALKSSVTRCLLAAGGSRRLAQQHRAQVQHHPQQAGPAEQALHPQRVPRPGQTLLHHLTALPPRSRWLYFCLRPSQKLFVPDGVQTEAGDKSQGAADSPTTNGVSESVSHVSVMSLLVGGSSGLQSCRQIEKKNLLLFFYLQLFGSKDKTFFSPPLLDSPQNGISNCMSAKSLCRQLSPNSEDDSPTTVKFIKMSCKYFTDGVVSN